VDWLLIGLPGLIWGASFLFIAIALDAVGPDGITFARIAIGFLTLACFPSARQAVPKRAWPLVALLGVIWMALPLTLFPHAQQHVSSALAGMLNGAIPLFATAVAAGLARRLPTAETLRGLAVGMAGAVLIGLPTVSEGGSSAGGVLLILVALICYGFALNLARALQLHHGAVPVLWRAQAVAFVLTAPLGMRDMWHARWAAGPVVALLALGVLGTGVAYVLLTNAAGRFGASRASSTNFIIAPVSLVLGVLVRHERVALLSVVGSAVCLAGAWLMRRAQLQEASGPRPA
jgi:drug/metabolite transporter (DMT)-like permease